MFGGIGFGVPFPFLGFAVSFAVFSVALLIIIGLKDIFEAQDIIW